MEDSGTASTAHAFPLFPGYLLLGGLYPLNQILIPKEGLWQGLLPIGLQRPCLQNEFSLIFLPLGLLSHSLIIFAYFRRTISYTLK